MNKKKIQRNFHQITSIENRTYICMFVSFIHSVFFLFYFIKTANIDCHIKCFTSIHLTDNLLNIFVLLLCFYKIGLQRMYLTLFFDGGKKLMSVERICCHVYMFRSSSYTWFSVVVFLLQNKKAVTKTSKYERSNGYNDDSKII